MRCRRRYADRTAPPADASCPASDTRQLLLPVTTMEFSYRYRGLSSIRRWKIDHRSTGGIDKAEANEREDTTGSGGGEVIIQMDWFTRSMNA